MREPYHTALSGGQEPDAEPCERFEINGSVGIAADLFNGLPMDFAVCDVLYAEPPWQAGFEIFNQRAGITEPRTYAGLMHALGNIATQQAMVPTFVMIGRQASKLLPPPSATWGMKLHTFPACCMAYHVAMDDPAGTYGSSDELIAYLAGGLRFSCVGHLACGFGNAALAFYRAGKRFVACDYNARCIGVLKRRLA